MQMGAVSFSVAIVDLMTAAVRWPGVALVIAVGVAGVSVLRMLALAVLVTRCAPLVSTPSRRCTVRWRRSMAAYVRDVCPRRGMYTWHRPRAGRAPRWDRSRCG
jgi:hypothetical protein